MSLLSFTEPEHVPLLLSHFKEQTTRPRRKIPFKVGETLYCYFKPRMAKSCRNCLVTSCPSWLSSSPVCTRHTNYYGEAIAGEIVHAWGDESPLSTQPINGEIYTSLITDWSSIMQDDWAKADGFPDFDSADDWFTKTYSKKGVDGSDWVNWSWDVLKFIPKWAARAVV